jgi:carboxypeptidase C (cathepsin A)
MRVLLVLLLSLFVTHPLAAQSEPQQDAKSESKKDDKKDEKKDSIPVTTNHEVTLNGKLIKYSATAGYLDQPDYEGKPKANVFFTSYTKLPDPGADPIKTSARPIIYCFNGGPGSSSVWLHLGCIGPRRVDFASPNEKPGEPSIPSPPYRLVDNEFSWLDLADLVFIDPVSTGYSRPVEGADPNQFHGLQEDIRWVGDFIRLWTTKNKRWDSPKFLAGESYGTTRAAGLSGYLQDTHGMNISGIIFISTVFNFQTLDFGTGNDTPYWLYLPTYCATAWYHHKLEPDLQADLLKTLREAERFASTEYLIALGRGDALAAAERDQIAAKIARYTGLSKQFVLNARLRIDEPAFTKELLRSQSQTVGRLDSRYTGIDRTDLGYSSDFDPSYSAIQGPFTSALNSYMRAELNYENDRVYEILTGRVHPWNFGSRGSGYANVTDTLRQAMTENRNLRVFFNSGYYDLATPYFATEYTIAHLGLDPSLKDHISHSHYECGHMMYIRHADLSALKSGVAEFVSKAAPAR